MNNVLNQIDPEAYVFAQAYLACMTSHQLSYSSKEAKEAAKEAVAAFRQTRSP